MPTIKIVFALAITGLLVAMWRKLSTMWRATSPGSRVDPYALRSSSSPLQYVFAAIVITCIGVGLFHNFG